MATTKQQQTVSSKGEDMIKQITLKELNPIVTCVLCRGYFIDPVTIVECLHSFCKTCIVEHIKVNKHCPICDTQINKTKPYLSMRLDKALQNIVYKLVPGLYTDEMERRRKFQEKNEPTKVPKEELERHFFFCDDKISMSLEYYDTDKSKNNNIKEDSKGSNPNKRYLACPGTVKIQHLMKFITMKYGLNSDNFVVDVIYKGDIIPEDYTLIDVAYYYKWAKDAPMQFFYRIFKKNKVLLKRRKRKSKSEDKITDGKKPRPVENRENHHHKSEHGDNNNAKENKKSSENGTSNPSKSNGTDLIGCRTVSLKTSSNPPALKDETKLKGQEKDIKKSGITSIAPPTLKAEKRDIKVSLNDDSSDDDDDKPPNEKKLKIDESPISAVSAGTSLAPTKVNKSPSEGIKIRVSLSDVKKVEPVQIKNDKKEELVVKKEDKKEVKQDVIQNKTPVGTPKLSSASPTNNANKARSNQNMLSNIVNNLAKKQLGSLNGTKDGKSPPPTVSLLGGQTTITKKEEKSDQVKEVHAKKDPNAPKGIPSGTSVTVRNISPSNSSPAVSSTTTVSFSNSFKSTNGNSSMIQDFVQADKSKKSTSSTLSDLRQFRKEGKSSPTMPSVSRATPIIPSLTSRTLTLGNSKSKTTSSPTSSSSGGVLNKPLPKPGEASSTSANNFLTQANNLSMLASFSLGLTDEQQKSFFRNMAAAASLLPPACMTGMPQMTQSVTQQLPSNRLKLTMQSSKSTGSNGGHASNPMQMLPSLASHMAPESQWKMFASLGAANTSSMSSMLASSNSAASKFGRNQSIRQIPNPSLLTKQASDQQQQLLQRAIAASQVAAAANVAAAATARTSLSQ